MAFSRKFICCLVLSAQDGQGATYREKTFFRLIFHYPYLPCLIVQTDCWVLGWILKSAGIQIYPEHQMGIGLPKELFLGIWP